VLEATGSNTHTFGRRSRAARVEANEEDEEDDNIDRALPGLLKQSATNQIRGHAGLEGEGGTAASLYNKDVIDPKVIDQKKRLLYDKSLKAYYDPETGQYFEMKAQLIPQGSLGQLEPEL